MEISARNARILIPSLSGVYVGSFSQSELARGSAVSLIVINDYNKACFVPPMDFKIRPLTCEDEPILWEMLLHGLASPGRHPMPSRETVRRPEVSRYVEGWGRAGDTGFVAHDKRSGALLGAVWLRQPTGKSDASPELALSVKAEHRKHGIGTALLTQLVRTNPDQSAISISFVAGKPILRLYERFGFKVVEERPDAVVMRRQT